MTRTKKKYMRVIS